MRKGDMEWVEMHLTPLRARLDAAEEQINIVRRRHEVLETRTKDMKRDHKANVLAVDQACNSARSLLQQANRAARAVKIIEDDEVVAEPGEVVNVIRTTDDLIRSARQANPERTVL